MKPQQYLSSHYKKIRSIHKGHTTEIWLVEENSTNQKYVLKIINRIGTPYPQMLKLQHQNLPMVYYAVETDMATYVIEEYLQGMNLQEYFDRYGSFNEATICQYAMEICDCLELLHSHHILHRDIKPSNLFLMDNHKLKLIDFDAGRVEKINKINDTQIIGTPGFASPEQYGFQQTDEKTDIYSLGLTLQVLLGFDNYKGFLLPVLKKCTEFDPSKRYPSAKKLKQAIKIRVYYHNLRGKLINAKTLCASVFIFIVWLIIKEEFAPNTEQEIQSKPTSIEISQPIDQLNQQAEIAPKEEESIQNDQNDTSEIFYEESFIEISEPPTTKLEELSTTNLEELPTQKLESESATILEELSESSTPQPQRDLTELYEKAATEEININQMPREILVNRLGKDDASIEEQNSAVDEYNRRLELNARVKALMEQLPEDMTSAERNAAHFEFYQQEKRKLNLE